ncbi:5942_t:CDS:2, partial [Rhizophagus irregularis]
MTLSTISSLELRKKIKQMEATYNMLAIKYQELENCMKNNNNQQKDTKQNIVNLQTNVTTRKSPPGIELGHRYCGTN